MDNGWVKLHRALLKKPIWKKSSPEHKTILITLLLMANHEKNEWEWMGEKFSVMPGQFVTSLESIQEIAGSGISIQNIRSAIEKFELYEFLTNESTSKGRMITICNWDNYQLEKNTTNKAVNKVPTKLQQSTNKVPTTNKNDKKDSNKDNILVSEVKPSETDPIEFKIVKNFWKVFSMARLKDGKLKDKVLNTAKFENWLNDLRLLREHDKRSIEDIREVYDYLKNEKSGFWLNTIKSISGLRNNFDGIMDSKRKVVHENIKSTEVQVKSVNDMADYEKLFS